MRGAAVRLVLAAGLLAGAAGAARAADRLAELFVPAEELSGGFEIVPEVSGDPANDADFRALGVEAVRAQHYTRAVGRVAEVCSVEVWAFSSEARAEKALGEIDYPAWRFLRHGELLILLRGVHFELGGGLEPGLFPACHEIGERTRARAAARWP